MPSLTEAAIKAARPGDVLKDHVVEGLQLRAFPQSKGFYLYYRTQAGQQRKPKLGTYGQLTLTTARDVARQWLAKVAAGQDPAAERQEARAEPTLDEAFEDFKAKHLAKTKTGTQFELRYRRLLGAKWGARKLSDVRHREVEEYKEAIGEPKPIGCGTPQMANRMLMDLSSIYTFARKRLKLEVGNPAKDIPRYPENKRRRYMRGDEPQRIAAILDRESHGPYKRHVVFIYLLILSGARKGEIGQARWEWLHGNLLELPDHKTADKTGEPRRIFLPPAALEVIARLPRDSGTICGIKRPTEFWYRVRKEAGCPDLRLHDLRHSFASAALGAGFTLAQIGELLGHKSTQTTMRYAHLVEEAALAASTATADRIMASMRATPSAERMTPVDQP